MTIGEENAAETMTARVSGARSSATMALLRTSKRAGFLFHDQLEEQ